MIRTIIIDDEPDCINLLALQLKMYCQQVKVEAMCQSGEEAIEQINAIQPDLVFLDIEMPVMNGFQLLDALGNISFSLVFVTAYDQFAVKAFRYCALDYLLKPIDTRHLLSAVQKAGQRRYPNTQQLQMLKHQIQKNEKPWPDKIALPYLNGVCFVEINNIIFCESENNYTRFHTIDGQQFMISKTLGDIQEILEERNFLRVHRQYLVNLDQIKKYVRGQGNYLVLSNDQEISVARNQKARLMERFGWL